MSSPEHALPILFLPGTLCDSRVFAPLSAILPDSRVIHADLTQDSGAPAAARRLLAAAPERFIAVGFSLGAIVALELAGQAPHRVAALALIAGNARPVPESDFEIRRAAVRGVNPGQLVGHDLWPRSVHPSRQADHDLRTQVVAMASTCPIGTVERQTELALSRADSRRRLPELAMPALIMSGAQDLVATPEMQAEMAEALPNNQWTQVPDAGHFLLLEQPAACAAAFSTWLAQADFQLSGAGSDCATTLSALNAPEVS